MGLKIFPIPPKSPDLNPIENIFHLAGKEIKEEGRTLGITRESYEEFQSRCQRTLMNFPSEIIDRTIDSMPNRLREVIKEDGARTKY